ncbi:MAG TPA: hypothetical protein VK796_04625 [Cytophaga sp.]|jgi:hypothetical protein|nr:hypothetical protein [Cytophaga sp.]
MKYTCYILFAFIVLASCTSSQTNEKTSSDTLVHAEPADFMPATTATGNTDTSNFRDYMSGLTTLNLPMHFKTGDDFIPDETTPLLYEKFKLESANNPGGRFFTNDRYSLLLDLIAGDVTVPALVTYTYEGVKIDSLIFFDASYEDENTFSQETVIIDDNLIIHRYDSTFSSKPNGAKKLTDTDSRIFIISTEGQFIEK